MEEQTDTTIDLDSEEKPVSLAPEWIPDEEVQECQTCLRPFTLTFRRHHCRGCGKIFCNICSKQKCLLPPLFGFQDGPERVCDRCSKQFFPYEPLMAVTPTGGKIEFGRIGTGPQIVLCFHGAPGNYSQGLSQVYMLFETPELREIYTVISVTRMGYGETTDLDMGNSPRDQANLGIQLLDELGIPRGRKVIVVSMSAGGPIGIEFCLNYPKRVASAIFLCSVTQKYWPGQGKGIPVEESGAQGTITKILMSSSTLQKAGVWILKKLSISYPNGTKAALRSVLTESSLWEPETIEKQIERIIEDPENVWALQTLLFSLGEHEGLEIDLENVTGFFFSFTFFEQSHS